MCGCAKRSWCILMYLDVSWCILMYLDVYILMYDIVWHILISDLVSFSLLKTHLDSNLDSSLLILTSSFDFKLPDASRCFQRIWRCTVAPLHRASESDGESLPTHPTSQPSPGPKRLAKPLASWLKNTGTREMSRSLLRLIWLIRLIRLQNWSLI